MLPAVMALMIRSRSSDVRKPCTIPAIGLKLGRSTGSGCQHLASSSLISLGHFFGNGGRTFLLEAAASASCASVRYSFAQALWRSRISYTIMPAHPMNWQRGGRGGTERGGALCYYYMLLHLRALHLH